MIGSYAALVWKELATHAGRELGPKNVVFLRVSDGYCGVVRRVQLEAFPPDAPIPLGPHGPHASNLVRVGDDDIAGRNSEDRTCAPYVSPCLAEASGSMHLTVQRAEGGITGGGGADGPYFLAISPSDVYNVPCHDSRRSQRLEKPHQNGPGMCRSLYQARRRE